jgi:hypothetical protein
VRIFFQRVMGVELGGEDREKKIALYLKEDPLLFQEDESFSINVKNREVSVASSHAKGILRAVHWLEDRMLLRRAPLFDQGNFRSQPKYRIRMVPGIYPAPSYFLLQEEQVWTPGYVWRLARAGYNAIYFQANLEELVEDSAIFPEMNDPNAATAIARLRRITETAAQYGVEVYFDLKTGYYKPFNEAVYQRHPEIRTFQKWGGHPCSGQQIVLDFYKETISHVFAEVEKLKGIVVIYDTEGFYSCFLHNNHKKCSYCKDFSVEMLATRLFNTFLEAIRSHREDTELILWSYFCDEPWNYRVIEAMPREATLMACFSQFRELERCGVRIRTDDYSICSDQPSEYFLKIQRLAQKKGMRFLCKTEDTFGQEFVSTPYTPCLEQHQRRWDQMERQKVDGFLAQYIHVGFMPSPCGDLTRQNIYAVEKDGKQLKPSAEQKLENTAILRYGRETTGSIPSAWREFSHAIRDYFPYTWGVCRYPGPLQSAPAQPFYLDPNRPMPRLRSRGYVKDLRWTGIDQRFLVDPSQDWNADVVSRCFQGFRHHYRAGIYYLEKALFQCAPIFKDALKSELNVARIQYLQVTSLLHFILFMTLREKYLKMPSRTTLRALIAVCENELENARQAYEITLEDSRIGFSCEGAGTVRGGLFTPRAIELKIASMQETLETLYEWLDPQLLKH